MVTSRSVHPPIGPDDSTGKVPIIEDGAVRGRRFARRRNVIGVVAAVVAAGAGIGIWLGTEGSPGSPLTLTSEVANVTTGTMQQTVAASGTIEPAQEANLDFAVSGQVTAVEVTTGQKVTAGQVLATIDPSALRVLVASAQASLSAAQAQLSSDQATDASTSQIDSDDAQIASAQTALSAAETNLADATLTSTIAGTVASVDLSVGEQVSGGGSAGGSSSSQIVVVSTTAYVVNTTVDDTQIGRIKTGDQVDIAPSGSNATVYGTVASMGLIATGGSGVAQFPVGITVTGSPSGLYAGASASVSIIVEQITDAVEVPTAAISYSPGGQATVTLVQNGRHVTRAITTGVSSGGETQVTSGVRPGEKVLEQVVTFNATKGGGPTLLGGNGQVSGGSFGGRKAVITVGGPPGG